MPLLGKIKRGARRAKDFFHRSSRDPAAQSPSATATNSPAPSPAPPTSSSVSIAAPAQGVSVPSSQPKTTFPAPTPASSSTAGPLQPDHSSANSGTAALQNPAVTQVASISPERTIGSTAWAGLKMFLELLDRSSDAFGPLKSAVGGVRGCIEIYERVGQGRKDYEILANELDSLFKDLTQYFGESTPPAMTSSLENLAQGIKNEVALVESKGRRNMGERILEANEDADEVLGCYSRIQRLLQRLQFNANVSVWKAVDEQTIEHRLDKLLPSLSALHNSDHVAVPRRGGCTPNTRVEVLKNLGGWAHNKESEKIYWLNGMAGTGKTTITYSLCDLLKDGKKLAASFFCSRQLPECSNPTLIFPTISYQLARFSAPFRFALSKAIEQDPDARIRRLPEQFKKLILDPLNAVKDGLPEGLVIVIDALDECENGEIVGQMLEVLFSHSLDLPIRFFLTSRPEPQIRKRMLSRQGERERFELHLHDLDRSIVKEDIGIYLRERLAEMSPTNADLERLAERSGALFIYAATVVRYLSFEDFSMGIDRLNLVLGTSPLSKRSAENSALVGSQEELGFSDPRDEEIDALYTAILKAGVEGLRLESKERSQRRLVLYTVVCAREPLSMSTMAGLLGLESTGAVNRALQPLLSVLNISKNGLVTTLHESFPDYMRDKVRSGTFYCDPGKHNAWLANQCFDVIKLPDPPFNICGLKSSHLFDNEVDDLEDRVEKSISRELLYACQYWGAHLELAENSEGLIDALSDFLQIRFLLWMEVLNLKQCIPIGASMLPRIQQWCKRAGCQDDVWQLAQDGWSFITSYASSPMSGSTPHIYISALPFWSENQAISRCYMNQIKGLVKPVGSAMGVRRSATLAICECGSYVRAVAYSPDGTRIVSGSDDNTVRIWDAHTGQSLGEPLQGHTSTVWSVGYSPDGSRIVSGSDDNTVRIWDARTGQSLGDSLRGHNSPINSATYFPDNTHTITGSEHSIVRTRCAYNNSPHDTCDPVCLWSHWVINEAGWVVDKQSKLLVWVPPELREVLLRPQSVVVISTKGSLGLDFSNAKLGESWSDCYQMKSSCSI